MTILFCQFVHSHNSTIKRSLNSLLSRQAQCDVVAKQVSGIENMLYNCSCFRTLMFKEKVILTSRCNMCPSQIYPHNSRFMLTFTPRSHLAVLESRPFTTWELPTTGDLILVWRGWDRSRPSNDHSRLLSASSDGRQSL